MRMLRWLGFDAKTKKTMVATAAALILTALATSAAHGAQTWAEKLGYPAGKRVLLLHANDAGMCYETNAAAWKFLGDEPGRSVSAMVPGPWFPEFAAWCRQHPSADVGVQFTLNSEWTGYRWSSICPRDQVPSLIDAQGYLWSSVLQTALSAEVNQVEQEVRAQLERARASGVQPTHLTTHLGAMVARPEFMAIYLKIARENWIPAVVVELNADVIRRLRERGIEIDAETIEMVTNYPLPKVDDLRFLPAGATYEERREGFLEMVRSLSPGITQIAAQPAVQSEALQKLTDQWQQRVWDAQLLSDPAVYEALEKEGVVLTNWKEIMRRFEGEKPLEAASQAKPAGPVKDESSAVKAEPAAKKPEAGGKTQPALPKSK